MADKQANKGTATPAIGEQGSRAAGLIPLAVFVVIVGGAALIWFQGEQHKQQQIEQRRQLNEQLGLPIDFPVDVVPIYEGVEILTGERGSATSTDGEPMDKWVITGQIDSDRKPILDFYNEVMIAKGMGQTQFISVPAADGSGANYQVSYADEHYLAEFYIQKLKKDLVTQIELTVYRVKD